MPGEEAERPEQQGGGAFLNAGTDAAAHSGPPQGSGRCHSVAGETPVVAPKATPVPPGRLYTGSATAGAVRASGTTWAEGEPGGGRRGVASGTGAALCSLARFHAAHSSVFRRVSSAERPACASACKWAGTSSGSSSSTTGVSCLPDSRTESLRVYQNACSLSVRYVNLTNPQS